MTTTGERPMNFMEEVNSETQAMLNQLTTKTIMSKDVFTVTESYKII